MRNRKNLFIIFDRNDNLIILRVRLYLPESSFFEQFASSRVPAWVTVTRVNHVFAMFTVITGIAPALVLSFWQRFAESFVRTRVSVARVTFGQDFFADRFCKAYTKKYVVNKTPSVSVKSRRYTNLCRRNLKQAWTIGVCLSWTKVQHIWLYPTR